MPDARLLLPAVVLSLLLTAHPAEAQQASLAPAVEASVEEIAAAGPLWPGFDPLVIPLAIYDGQATWLFRHPAPPAGFVPAAGGPAGSRTYPGRYDAVTSNTSAEIGGTMTATLLANGPRGEQSPRELAAVAIHEAFHVYQRTHHAGWQGNEADLMVYPVTNADLLALRRLESEGLRRALANAELAGAACWARVAMAQRRERFAAMDSAFVAYERLTELNEGLAAYLQLRAAGSDRVNIPADGFLPEAVRQRAYHAGPAMALLLDRLNPGWQDVLERGAAPSLDSLLDAALSSAPASAACDFTAVETAAAKRSARIAAAAVLAGWGTRQRAFETKEGWRVVIESAKGRPLWPQGFDPLNLDRVDGALIHTRFLKLGNDAGVMTALDEDGADIEARTEGVGPHPMFNGVAWVEVVLSVRPAVRRAEGRLIIAGPGFSAEFKDATLIESGRQLLVRLDVSGTAAADTGYAAMQARGREAMGVDQYASSHIFEDLPDGGRIVLQVNAPDTAGTDAIREHMGVIAAAFSRGDFAVPGFVHGQEVPGTAVMAARRADITYVADTLPRGGQVRITTSDSVAVAAIHEFLAFQREAHHAAGHGAHGHGAP